MMSPARTAAHTTTKRRQRKIHSAIFLDAPPTLHIIDRTEAMMDTIPPKIVSTNMTPTQHRAARCRGVVKHLDIHTRAKETVTTPSTILTGIRPSALDHAMAMCPNAASHRVDTIFVALASRKYLRFAHLDVAIARGLIARSMG
ncbi:hypothetical protein PMIN06_001855 [Paraphaeosphaeria minitans]